MIVNINGIPGRKYKDNSYVFQPIDSPDKIEILESLFKDYNVKGLSFTNETYWQKNNLELVAKFKGIQTLHLGNPLIKDFSGLKYLKKLEILGINERINSSIDLGLTPRIKKLQFHCNYNKLKNIDACKELEFLECSKLKNKSKNFLDFPQLTRLKELKVVTCNFENLIGIENFPQLEKLELFYFSKLKTLNGIDKLSNLKEIKISNAKRIETYTPIGNCSSLEEVSILSTSPIQDFNQILKNKNLKSLIFSGTDVGDGDLTPLLDRVWDYIAFTNKKHFSHKYTQLPAKQYVVNGQFAYPKKVGEPLEPMKKK